MSNTIKPSITRIDLDLYKSSEKYRLYSIEDVYESFFHYIDKAVESKGITVYSRVEEDYHSYVYTYGNEVEWKEMISDLVLQEIPDKGFFYTKYPSFIIVISVKEDVYCVTGGLANHLISDYKDKMFGVNLICKIVEPTDQIIRHVSDRRVYGRINSSKVSNRTASSFVNERNYESIFNEFGTVIETEVQKVLGIRPQFDKDGNKLEKDVFINFASTIHIGKPTSFSELKEITKSIAQIMDDAVPFKFVINFLVPVNQVGIKQKEVYEEFYKYIVEHPSELNIGYNYEINKLIDLSRFRNSGNSPVKQEFIEKYSTKTMNDINDLKKLLVNYLTEKESPGILKNYYFKFDTNEHEKSKVKLRELLDQEFSYKGIQQVYLIEGTWYRFLDDYTDFLNQEYEVFYDSSIEKCTELFGSNHIDLDVKAFRIESDLKKEILKRDNLIDADMRYIKSIEIADAIYIENNDVYLLHNKTTFNGPGSRDITGQINTSMRLISSIRSRDPELLKEFNKYIKSLKDKNKDKIGLIDDFKRLLRNSTSRIIYIASFTDSTSRDTNSNYIKYLLHITNKQLTSQNFEFYLN
jgi:hypothetical protein